MKRTLLSLVTAASLTAPAVAQDAPAAGTMPPLPAPAASGYAPVNGVEVYYAVYGEGDPLVLIHGGFGAIEMFGPVLARLAEGRQVIGIDLQAHGRTLPFDREMTFENLAGDVAGLIRHLGFETADVMGYSTGGQVALRTALDHPDVVDRLVLVSTPYARAGWQDFNLEGMSQIGPGSAEGMKQTPMFEMFAAINPDPETNWPKLHEQQGHLVNIDYDWSGELGRIASPTLLVAGDWDSTRITHVVDFFSRLGGGAQDGGWDGSGMNPHRLAILPSTTHYTIFMDERLADAVIPFLDAE